MQGLKKALVGVAIVVFIPLCGWLASSFAINRTITKPEYIKDTLATSGFYDALAKQVQARFATDSEGLDVPKIVQKSLEKSVTASQLQSNIEPVIDTTYGVLDDPHLVLDKKVDIKPLKDSFSATLTSQLREHAKNLPACTLANPPQTSDIFTTNCIPPGTDVEQVIDDAVVEVMATEGVPADTVSLSGLVADSPGGKGLIAQASVVFGWAKLSVYMAIVLLGVAATVIIALSATKRGGVHRVTTLLLTAAILLAGSSWLILFVLGRVNFVAEQSVSIESSLGSAFRILSLDIFRVVLWFSVLYGVLGVAMLAALYATEKKKQKPGGEGGI